MDKIKIFQTLRRHYAILGISSSNQSAQKCLVNKRILIFFLLFGCSVVSQLVYIRLANSFLDSMDCICSLYGGGIICVCFTAIVCRKNKLFETIEDIEKLIDSSMPFWSWILKWFVFLLNKKIVNAIHSRIEISEIKKIFLENQSSSRTVDWDCFQAGSGNSTAMFHSTEVYCQFWHLLHDRCGKWCIPFAVTHVVNFICEITQLRQLDFFQQIKKNFCSCFLRLPFDSNNPVGYLIAVIIAYVLVGCAYFIIACTLGLGIGAYWFAISSTKEIKHTLHLINDKAHRNLSNKLKVLFSKFIYGYGIVKQLSINSNVTTE